LILPKQNTSHSIRDLPSLIDIETDVWKTTWSLRKTWRLIILGFYWKVHTMMQELN